MSNSDNAQGSSNERSLQSIIGGLREAGEVDGSSRGRLFWLAADALEELSAEVARWKRSCTGRHGSQAACVDSHSGETSGELEQLRRIDKAARAFVNACEHKVRIPNEPFAALCNALFDGRAAQETPVSLRVPDANGWKLDTRLIRAIHDECRGDDYCPSEEGIELVLLAFEKLTE